MFTWVTLLAVHVVQELSACLIDRDLCYGCVIRKIDGATTLTKSYEYQHVHLGYLTAAHVVHELSACLIDCDLCYGCIIRKIEYNLGDILSHT